MQNLIETKQTHVVLNHNENENKNTSTFVSLKEFFTNWPKN